MGLSFYVIDEGKFENYRAQKWSLSIFVHNECVFLIQTSFSQAASFHNNYRRTWYQKFPAHYERKDSHVFFLSHHLTLGTSPRIPRLSIEDSLNKIIQFASFTFHVTWLMFLNVLSAILNSSTLAWKIPWMEERGRLQSMRSLRVGRDWATSLSRIGEGNGNPLQCSCLENSRDGAAWWAAEHGVAQGRTRLKWLSSSSSSSYLKSLLYISFCPYPVKV